MYLLVSHLLALTLRHGRTGITSQIQNKVRIMPYEPAGLIPADKDLCSFWIEYLAPLRFVIETEKNTCRTEIHGKHTWTFDMVMPHLPIRSQMYTLRHFTLCRKTPCLQIGAMREQESSVEHGALQEQECIDQQDRELAS